MKTATARRLLIFTITAGVAAMLTTCARDTKKNDTGKKDPPQSDNGEAGFSGDISRRYLTEGFIAESTFRVIIVATKEESTGESEAIKNKAQKRALATIEKYLRSSNQRVDGNVRAKILGLLNNSSSFYRKDTESQKYDVYYLDISHSNIRGYLKKIAGDYQE